MNINIYQVHCLILYSLRSIYIYIYFFIWIIVVRMSLAVFQEVITVYDCGIWLKLYIQFIDLFCTCLDLYIVSFHLNYCRWYVICYFTTSHFLYYCEMLFISHPVHWLILYLLRFICFFFMWIIVVRMSLAVFQ